MGEASPVVRWAPARERLAMETVEATASKNFRDDREQRKEPMKKKNAIQRLLTREILFRMMPINATQTQRSAFAKAFGRLTTMIVIAHIVQGCAGSTVKVGACYEGACVDVEVTKPATRMGKEGK